MKTCLVVDDSSVIRKVARRILEGLDFQIVEAEDGEKALEICKRALPDMVDLLDAGCDSTAWYQTAISREASGTRVTRSGMNTSCTREIGRPNNWPPIMAVTYSATAPSTPSVLLVML